MLTVAYLAYGNRRLTRTTVFSALTWMHAADPWRDRWRMVVYTDAPDLFREHGVRCELIGVDELAEAPNPTGYGYRRKLLAIADCARRSGGDVLFLDGDTYLLRAPDRLIAELAGGRAVLHVVEETLTPETDAELHRVLQEHDFASPALRAVRERGPLRLWNSGAVGIPERLHDRIPAVVEACDELYAACPRHTIEQVAWSIVLEQAGEIAAADDVVLHYWWDWAREQLNHRIGRFFRSNAALTGDALAAAAWAARPEPDLHWRVPLELRARRMAGSARDRARALRA